MKPLRDNFREGAPISQVPASWFNAVAKFINSLIPGYGISWAKSESSNIIEVDPDVLGGAKTVKSVNSIFPDANGDVDLGDIVNSVDGHSPDANGNVSFGLTASKWMKTDASGYIATTNDTPIALPSGYTGQDSTFTVVTDVTWNGTTLQKKTRSLTFKNGALTTVGNETTSTIDTPVAYTP